MVKKKKILIILFSILCIIIIGLASAYFIYGSTLLNGYNESTIIESLSEDKDNPIEILAMERYENHLVVLYKDPIDDDPYDDYAHFDHYMRHNSYKNRYKYKGGSPGGNVTCPAAWSLTEYELKVPYFIHDIGRDENRCIVYEEDAMGNTVRKLDEFEVPRNEPYIILKEYELLNILHRIEVVNASGDYPRVYNENYLEADKEFFGILKDVSDEKHQKETDEFYKKAFGNE